MDSARTVSCSVHQVLELDEFIAGLECEMTKIEQRRTELDERLTELDELRCKLLKARAMLEPGEVGCVEPDNPVPPFDENEIPF